MATSPRAAAVLLLAGLAALADGCACGSVPDGAITDCSLSPPVPQAVRTDILFVIDDSGSMSQEQTNLRTNLGNFIQGLKDSPVANDYQIGVTTTSVQNFDGTPSGEQGALIADVPNPSPAVLVGSSPTLVDDFKARVIVGTGGAGKEQPFRAMKLALSSPLIEVGGANEGFLRQGARLAVVFLTDEDDCSDSATPKRITGTTTNTGNNQCHNDAGDGVDYKFDPTLGIDPIADYVSFLTGPLGPTGAQEVKDVAVAAIVGVDGATGAPSCGDSANNNWCCGSGGYNTCPAATPPVCGSHAFTVAGLAGDAYCCGGTSGTACTSSCATAFDKADRFQALLSSFAADRKLTAAICDASYANTLTQIACMLVPQDVPLDTAPADWRMMTVALVGGGATTGCTVALDGSAGQGAADVVYSPPSGDVPAVLHFQNACRLGCGKRIEINLICAG